MWNDKWSAEGLSLFGRANFDPLTDTGLALGAVGTGISAYGTLAGGSYAQQAADYKAAQLRQNAAGEIAASQRQMMDKQFQTRMLTSTAVARAGASGVAADVGSPATDVADIAQRGEYQSLMSLWQGENAATGCATKRPAWST